MGSRQGRAADARIEGSAGGSEVLDVSSSLPVVELADVVVTGDTIKASNPLPTQEDICSRLHQALSGDYPLSVVGEATLADKRLEHRGLGLLDLQEERIVLVATHQQKDVAAVPTLPTPTTLRAAWT